MKKKKKPMRPGGGAAKGGKNERKLARALSSWWYGDEGYLWRRPGSGHISRLGNRHTGDILPVADRPLPDRWPFHIETKHYAKARLKLSCVLWPKRNPILKIWRKAVNERRKDLVPLMILRSNNTDPVAVMRLADANRLINILNESEAVPVYQYIDTYVVMHRGKKQPVIIFPWLDLEKYPRSQKTRKNFDAPKTKAAGR